MGKEKQYRLYNKNNNLFWNDEKRDWCEWEDSSVFSITDLDYMDIPKGSVIVPSDVHPKDGKLFFLFDPNGSEN